jgi:hypothetical protein
MPPATQKRGRIQVADVSVTAVKPARCHRLQQCGWGNHLIDEICRGQAVDYQLVTITSLDC